jgi:hypothetical protein
LRVVTPHGRRLVRALSIASILAVASSAHADGPYEGEWRSGAMQIEVAVESWGADCGPRPQSTTVPGGATVRVTQSGDDLTFHGRPPRSTRGCWSENAAVRRVSARYQAGTWTIVCRTPEDDPRGEVGTYTLHAVGNDRIEFRDVSRYDWRLNTSHCRATITSTQTFERVAAAQPQPPPQQPQPTAREPTAREPTEREPACTPGPAARISIRPTQGEISPGERICFQARVVDTNGCPLPQRTPSLELRMPPGARGELRGTCFQAAGNAAEGEGEFTIVAREGGFEARARVRVRTPDLSDLIARRAEGGGAVSFSSDDGALASSEEAARVAAWSETQRPSLLCPILGAIVGALLVMAGSIALFVRSRRRTQRLVREGEGGIAVEGGASLASHAPAPAPPLPAAVPAVGAQPAATPKICPVCRRGYPPEATRCTSDGTELMFYPEFLARGTGAASTRVCPLCGRRYPATTRFCGEDGTTLVDG